MAVVAYIVANSASVDTRDGNHYEIYTVTHTTGTDTAINVPDSCVSCALLGDNQLVDSTGVAVPAVQTTTDSTGISLQNKTSGTSGLSFGDWATNDGVKQIIIDGNVVNGTYKIVARLVGSASGVGGGTKQSDF